MVQCCIEPAEMVTLSARSSSVCRLLLGFPTLHSNSDAFIYATCSIYLSSNIYDLNDAKMTELIEP